MADKKAPEKAAETKTTVGKKATKKKGKKVEAAPAHVPETMVSVRTVTGVRQMTLAEYEASKKK